MKNSSMKISSWFHSYPKFRENRGCLLLWTLAGVWLSLNLILAMRKSKGINQLDLLNDVDRKILHRNRRFIYMNNKREFRLPPGTILAFSGVASLPFLGNLPVGYGSGLTIAVPITIKFDDLDMTSEDNRFGYLDIFNLQSFVSVGRSIQPLFYSSDLTNGLKETLTNMLHSRRKRSLTETNLPGVNYAGGDRETVYQYMEDLMSNFGIDGKSCILRAICEVHEAPIKYHGFFGEVLQLLLSPSYAAFSEIRLPAYLEAETNGKRNGSCESYYTTCPYTLFSPKYFESRYEHTPKNRTVHDFSNDISNTSHHHLEKRFIYFGPHRNIFLPPSTKAVWTPTLNLPFLRDLPKGYKSQISYSMPFSIKFDDLGLTSALNHFGYLPFLKRKRRQTTSRYAGRDREMIYAVLIESLTNIGLNGEACLLRTICEIHEAPLMNHGLFGEIFNMFLTPSLVTDSLERLKIFLHAERIGRYCGDCSAYHKKCPNTLFTQVDLEAKRRSKSKLNQCSKLKSEERTSSNSFMEAYKSHRVNKNIITKSSSSQDFIEEIADKINLKRIFENDNL